MTIAGARRISRSALRAGGTRTCQNVFSNVATDTLVDFILRCNLIKAMSEYLKIYIFYACFQLSLYETIFGYLVQIPHNREK
uniref:Uncharacterized protein n=1 Tax=Pararge aegeria TaxID=116150 RepID=S4PEB6_9NEOP